MMGTADEKRTLDAIFESLFAYGLAGGWGARVQIDEGEARAWLIPVQGRTVCFRDSRPSLLAKRVADWAKRRTMRGRQLQGEVWQ